jgi:hypothetical protein
MNYKLLFNKRCNGLSEVVEEYLSQGWKLHGDPYYADGLFIQAVVIVEREAFPRKG